MTGTLYDALLDVRKAYRLLADYQQRMFELLAYIRDQLGADAYHHQYAYPLPKSLDGLEVRDNSGWRYLPFYDLSAIWLRPAGQQKAPWDHHQAGDLMYGAWVRSDTGFDIYSGQFNSMPVEQARSELVLSVVVCDEPAAAPYNWYAKVWQGMDYPEDGEINSTDLPGYRCFSKTIPLERLEDESAIKAVLEEWRCLAGQKLSLPVPTFHPAIPH
ncbi:hypothetical protein [Halopseudomonas pelagia]|uniref:hypothetical protein n=1 Tax=Halopseudomonas pelagia TaxID=553151 RepID=UPI00039CAD97|nr:hypothetical protein [Halopseudomonas pelagia]